jgi:hypothetical protein
VEKIKRIVSEFPRQWQRDGEEEETSRDTQNI